MSLLTGKNYIVIPKATTVERLALTAVNGMLVYDTTLNAFYKYENGAWGAFGGGGGVWGSITGTLSNQTDLQTALNGKLDIHFKRSLQTFTGVTAERALDIIPLDVNSFDYLYRFFVWSRVDISTATVRIRIGTYAAPIDGAVGANSIGQQTLLGSFALTSNNRSPFVRNINIVGGASGSAVSMVAAVLSDELQVATSTSVAIDTTTQLYMYVSVGLSASTRVFTSDSAVVTKIKLT